MKKPAIPQVPQMNQTRQQFDRAIKENIEVISGRRGGAISQLPATATNEDIINKINELIMRLQG